MNLRNTYSPQPTRQNTRRYTLPSITTLLHNTLTNTYLCLYHKTSKKPFNLQQTQQMIAQYFKEINSLVQHLGQHISRRLQAHQKQLLAVTKNQIQGMQGQAKQLAGRLSQQIDNNNQNEVLWRVNNQLDYFKTQAHNLFIQNNKLRIQKQMLLVEIKNYEMQRQADHGVMMKLQKKYMKQKIINQNVKEQGDCYVGMKRAKVDSRFRPSHKRLNTQVPVVKEFQKTIEKGNLEISMQQKKLMYEQNKSELIAIEDYQKDVLVEDAENIQIISIPSIVMHQPTSIVMHQPTSIVMHQPTSIVMHQPKNSKNITKHKPFDFKIEKQKAQTKKEDKTVQTEQQSSPFITKPQPPQQKYQQQIDLRLTKRNKTEKKIDYQKNGFYVTHSGFRKQPKKSYKNIRTSMHQNHSQMRAKIIMGNSLTKNKFKQNDLIMKRVLKWRPSSHA